MKLTDEQIDQAAKAMFESGAHSCRWFHLGVLDQEGYRQMALEATPFLQLPWEAPSRNELAAWSLDALPLRNAAGDFQYGGYCYGQALTRFVERRNAALLSKPVDPRRAKIIAALSHKSLTTTEDVADRILAALAALDAKD